MIIIIIIIIELTHSKTILENYLKIKSKPAALAAALTFLKIKLNGINAKTYTKGDKKSA